MNKCAIIIGVNNTGGLPPLSAAVSGAMQFCQWAAGQNFDTTLLTDEEGPVTINEIKKAVLAYVDARKYSQIIIYFSGHGILKGPLTELWLLSEAPGNPDEAVNVVSSSGFARFSGIPHVVFISDACRSKPADMTSMQVTGGHIFPNQRSQQKSVIDMFYATMAGDTAYEVPANTACSNFKGLYTDCLLDGLYGKEESIIQPVKVDGKEVHVIPAFELSEFLQREVPERAGRVNIMLHQVPDGEILSRIPLHLAKITVKDVDSGLLPGPPVTPLSSRRATMKFQKQESSTFKEAMNAAIEESVLLIRESGGRLSFETGTGFSIFGDTEARVVDYEWTRPIHRFLENGVVNIRIDARYMLRRTNTLLLQLNNGSIIPLGILPNFIGTVVVKDGTVLNINYTPSSWNTKFKDYQNLDSDVGERRARVAALAKFGKFRVEGNPEQVIYNASYLRYLKAFDPTLGLYAAYAYAQVGDFDNVLSVLEYMVKEPEPVLFDVVLLAKVDTGNAERIADLSFKYYRNAFSILLTAPYCPALTQGWSFLPMTSLNGIQHLQNLKQFLLPGLWTTFSPNAENILKTINNH